MGDPMTYLTVEPATAADWDHVRDALDAWRPSWATTVELDGTLGSRDVGIVPEMAERFLDDLGGAVARALVVTVNGTSHVGTGRLFARVDDELLVVDVVTGGQNRGVDVVDYVRRHHGFDGVGYDA